MSDCISREAVIELTWEEPSYIDALNVLTEIRDKVESLPSVTPIERTMHWIEGESGNGYRNWICSNCKMRSRNPERPWYLYCPKCGAKVVEPQESEE